VVKHFWAIVKGMSELDRKRLLCFVTGSPRVPVGGFAKLPGDRFTLLVSEFACPDPNGLPRANVCNNQLVLPRYKTPQIMRQRILFAIQHMEFEE